ncbi:hypothetical protein LPJ61_000760 [Coemansia biformis]|uniref:Exonuclease 1 n=1 Tax=Coemansia biformis TaxID=1286918 RepID=A0A9W7YB74_9FUNG|nr:hypothetical protein LPJ61_000760 [Coemansia biformis]
MGITGLLPLLSEAQRKGHVKEFAGQTVGVDSYIWLYKGAFSCAVEIGLGTPTMKYVNSFMTRARMLRHYGVEPLFVFDGGPLPSKRETELERQRSRMEKREKAIKLWNQSKRKAAFEMFQRCLEATPQMARAVIDCLQEEGFRYLVAPYEADAQLAYLETQGIIAASISEDSDLIAFGCKKILLKMDQYGAGVVFDRSRIHRAKAVDIGGWSDAQIRRMCILSGCDYAASPPGIGLKKAHRYVMRSTTIGMAVVLMRADGVAVPDGYEEAATRAELTFLYQRVYDPRTKSLAHVMPLEDGVLLETMPFIGSALVPQVAQDIAEGTIDPFSFVPFSQPAAAATVAVAAAAEATAETTRQAAVPGAPSPKARTPAAPRGTLVNLWKKSAFATISAKPSVAPAQPADEEPATVTTPADPPQQSGEEPEDAVRVKFRARDATSDLVATAQHSRFFAKPKQAEGADSGVAAPTVPETDNYAEEPSPQSTVVAPETPERHQLEVPETPETQTQVECSQLSAAEHGELEGPLAADQTDTQDAGATQVCEPPDDVAQSSSVTRIGVLLASFTSKAGSAPAEMLATSRQVSAGTVSRAPGRVLALTQMSRRISGEMTLSGPADSIEDFAPPKRKGKCFLDVVSKYQCTARTTPWADPRSALPADEIVDCSDSDKENAVCA